MDVSGTFIIIACYNDGSAITKLLLEIEEVLKNRNEDFTVVVVDDGSNETTVQILNSFRFHFENIQYRVLRLDYNRGHQAAIEQGILFVQTCKAQHAIIMDGDGEDDPAAIPSLLNLREFDIVHVLRGKREDKWNFKVAYWVYKTVFQLITLKNMNSGNFCMINTKVINIIQMKSFIHLAAFLSKLPLKSTSVTFDKRIRHAGQSQMSVPDLIHHAFRSFVEYAEELVMVFLRLFVVLFLLFIITIGYILYLKLFTNNAILGWTSTLGIGLLTSALVCIGFFITGVLLLNLAHGRIHRPPVPVYKIVI